MTPSYSTSGSVVYVSDWLSSGSFIVPDRDYSYSPRRRKIMSPFNKCAFCGTRSKLENMHGNCISCGAPLPDREYIYEDEYD